MLPDHVSPPVSAFPPMVPAATRPAPDRITGQALAAFFCVHRELGSGFDDGVYSRALGFELGQRGLSVERDVAIPVFYKGMRIGQYRAPFIIEGTLLLDVQAGPKLDCGDERHLVHALAASGCAVALLLHFGPAATFRHAERGASAAYPCLPTPGRERART
jgi:GxxExxY protein